MLDIFADLSGLTSVLRDILSVLLRIAESLERVAPPLASTPPDQPADGLNAHPADPSAKNANDGFHLSESPSEYQERIDHDAALAGSLGVAPWSPDFQRVVAEVRNDLMKARYEQGQETSGLTEAEADDVIRQAFQIAKAETNARRS